jgi:hypothetical protein
MASIAKLKGCGTALVSRFANATIVMGHMNTVEV